MIRVLNVFPVSDIGGAETVILNLIRYRERSDIDHQAVLLCDVDGALGAALTELRVPWSRFSRGRMRYPMSLWRACRQLRRLVREAQIDLLLANSAQGFLYSKCATVGLRLPALLYYMAVPKRKLFQNGILDVLMAKFRPTAVFTASKKISAILSELGLTNVQPVYHGTPIQRFTVDEKVATQEILSKHGVPETARIILLPGRLQPWKGQALLIDAMPDILKACPDAHAVLLGDTLFGHSLDYPHELRQQIADLGINQHVHLVGQHPIRAWLERATVVVHASTEPDPFPNTCIEALAARRPLVTNTLSGTTEILTDKVDALIVRPNDPTALAAAVIELLANRSGASNIAEAGFQRYLTTCTPAHMVRPIEATLASLCPKASAHSGTEMPVPC
jgi:glycosyltransferase involved in cell wall biosynthesis